MPTETRVVPIEQLVVSATNARKDISAGQEDANLSGLAQSIREKGLLNPLTVRARADGRFDILAGQRRYLACRELGMAEIPVIVRDDVSDTSAVELSVVENMQRADMHPLDKSTAFEELRKKHNGNLREVSEVTGVSVTTIQRYLRLLALPDALKSELGTSTGSAGIGTMEGIARTFDKPEDMVEAWNKVGGFTQSIQQEILKRSGGDVNTLPELVLQAQEGAFDTKRCGSSIEDCPHIPDALRKPLNDAIRAMSEGTGAAEKSLKDFAARHKKR